MWKTTLLRGYLKFDFVISLLGMANLIPKGVITVLSPAMARSGVLKSGRFFILLSLFALSCSLKALPFPLKNPLCLRLWVCPLAVAYAPIF